MPNSNHRIAMQEADERATSGAEFERIYKETFEALTEGDKSQAVGASEEGP